MSRQMYSVSKDANVAQEGVRSSLLPAENKHDDNKCGDDEEEFGGACYKTCRELTAGQAPYRTSPISCCAKYPCPMSMEKVKVRLCDGYDVAGDAEGRGKCPHKEGVCLNDEEIHLGLCYKKCSVLTNGMYMHRRTATQCCKYNTLFKCLYWKNTDTSFDYVVGGGKGDGDDKTPNKPHMPIGSLTEERD
mmetsp:Transcript_84082/g.116158  ORF Transcript_84082/g.116158 Transcript_84082/m.116158 type:complete len:190 (+) Transcript_84082:3-572(+)